MNIIQLGLRALTVIFSAIVLALAIELVKGQVEGSQPASIITYSAFCGAWGILVALTGTFAAIWDKFPTLVMAGIDGLTNLFFLAASIAFAQQLGVHSCAANQDELKDAKVPDPPKNGNLYTVFNPIIRAGGFGDVDYVGRCEEAQACTAFLFFALGCFIGSLVLDFFSGGGSMKMPGRRAGASHV